MTEKIVAEAKPENLRGKQIRRILGVPFVIYGKGVKENRVGVLTNSDVRKVVGFYRRNEIFNVQIGKSSHSVLVKDIQIDAVSVKPLHFDLLEINLNSEVEVEVPLNLIGESAAEKSSMLSFIVAKTSLNVKCRADSIPEFIEFDISEIESSEDSIFVKDIVAPKNVEILDDPEDSVIFVADVAQRGSDKDKAKEGVESTLDKIKEGVENEEEDKSK